MSYDRLNVDIVIGTCPECKGENFEIVRKEGYFDGSDFFPSPKGYKLENYEWALYSKINHCVCFGAAVRCKNIKKIKHL